MKFKILTLFPEIFPGPLSYAISGKAIKRKLFKIETINIRDFSKQNPKLSMTNRMVGVQA